MTKVVALVIPCRLTSSLSVIVFVSITAFSYCFCFHCDLTLLLLVIVFAPTVVRHYVSQYVLSLFFITTYHCIFLVYFDVGGPCVPSFAQLFRKEKKTYVIIDINFFKKKNKIKINWLTKKPTCFGKEITSDFSLKEKIY